MSTRRDVLLAAPALAAAVALPASGAAVEPDPHLAWLEHWKRCRETINAAEEGEDAELWTESDRLEHLICETPASTAADAVAQLEVAFEDDLVGHEYADQRDQRLFQNVLETLRAHSA